MGTSMEKLTVSMSADVRLWRTFVARTTGMPIDWVLALRDESLGTKAREALSAETQLDERRKALLDSKMAFLKSETSTLAQPERAELQRFIKRVQKFQSVEAGTDVLVEQYRDALVARDRTRAAMTSLVIDVTERSKKKLSEITRIPLFQEAVVWQNRAMYSDLKADAVAERGAGDAPQVNRRSAKLAAYLYRYATKCETIGFFGPAQWGKLDDVTAEFGQTRGPLVTQRRTFWEWWAVNVVGSMLLTIPGMQRWTRACLSTSFRCEGSTLVGVDGTRTPLEEPERRIVCDLREPHSTHTLVEQLAQAGPDVFAGEDDVLERLGRLASRGIVRLYMDTPPTVDADQHLLAHVRSIEDTAVREPAERALVELEAVRAAVDAAGGDPNKLFDAMRTAEETFERITTALAVRAPGATYGARTLFHEECRRGGTLHVSPDVTKRLGPGADFMSRSIRWCSWEIARRVTQVAEKIFDSLTAEHPAGVPVGPFLGQLAPVVVGACAKTTAEFKERLWEVVAAKSDDRRIERGGAEFDAAFRTAFPAPGAGWPAARFGSPDVMIAASSVEDIRAGKYELVLSEIHPAVPSLTSALFMATHPNPDEVRDVLVASLPERALLSFNGANDHSTARVALDPGQDTPQLGWMRFDDRQIGRTERWVSMADLVVERAEGRVQLRDLQSGLVWSPIEIFNSPLSAFLIANWDFRATRPHTPRLTVHGLAVARETWRLLPTDVPVEAFEKFDRSEIERWAEKHGLPALLFVKFPQETKPFLLDLNGPISWRIFASTCRAWSDDAQQGAPVVITEMLPAPDQVWFTGEEGERYCCELRTVIVDTNQAVHPGQARGPASSQ